MISQQQEVFLNQLQKCIEDPYYKFPGSIFNNEKVIELYNITKILRNIISDLLQDSTAYQLGVQEGIRSERQRCANICRGSVTV